MASQGGGQPSAGGPRPFRRRIQACDSQSGFKLQHPSPTVTKSVTATPALHHHQHNAKRTAVYEVGHGPRLPVTAAGVLFFSLCPTTGHTLFLLGRENSHSGWADSNLWADFGGSVDSRDRDIYDTAAREAYEETMGLLCDREELANRLRNNDNSQLAFDIQVLVNLDMGVSTHAPYYYRIFLVQVPYMHYDIFFDRMRTYMRRTSTKLSNADKSAIAWVRADRLVADSFRAMLRPAFSQSVHGLAAHIDLTGLGHVAASERASVPHPSLSWSDALVAKPHQRSAAATFPGSAAGPRGSAGGGSAAGGGCGGPAGTRVHGITAATASHRNELVP